MQALGMGAITRREKIANDVAEIERRAHDQKSFRPGEAGKFDPHSAPHVAAGAVGADQPAAGPPVGTPIALDRNLHARAMLGHLFDSRVELQLELRFGAELLVQDARELELLALYSIGMAGHVGNFAEIELRQHAMPLAAILELRRNQALRDQRCPAAEPTEQAV